MRMLKRPAWLTKLRLAKLKVVLLLCLPAMLLVAYPIRYMLWNSRGAFYTNAQLRAHVEERIALDELQAWAVEAVEQQSEDHIPGESLPPKIRSVGGSVLVIEADGDVPRHILIILGGGFQHAGVRVGPPGFRPGPDSQFTFDEWIPGVWGQVE